MRGGARYYRAKTGSPAARDFVAQTGTAGKIRDCSGIRARGRKIRALTWAVLLALGALVIFLAAVWQKPSQTAVVSPTKTGCVLIAPNVFVNDPSVEPKMALEFV